ncbi:hypothetical protein [Sphingobium xenophagum]|nr:hypothetical protein [Sphingobium xenophagum]
MSYYRNAHQRLPATIQMVRHRWKTNAHEKDYFPAPGHFLGARSA